MGSLVDRGIRGGAAHDAVNAIACRRAGLTLLTLDERARATYERVGIDIQFLG